VRSSGLSAPSVTNVVATLISTGLVQLLGEGDSTGGRPPEILRFNAGRGCVAGVEITHHLLRFVLADLNGRELAHSETLIQKSKSKPSEIHRQIGNAIRQLLRQRKLKKKQLLRLTVGVPAIVNVEEGRVLALTPLQNWSNVPLGPMLARELNCNVLVDNDTNLAAEGEFHSGAAQGEKNFVFITMGEGVGSGIFLNGSIYRGSQWSAGEIGYLRVPNISREHPAIRKYGKLETALSASGILKAWRATADASKVRQRVNRVSDVWDLASSGNAAARRILKQRATILADVIVDLALILNPTLILLGGEVGNHPVLLHEVNAQLQGSEFAVGQISLGSLGSSAVLRGAVSVALEPAIRSLLTMSQETGTPQPNFEL
jgi:glucokinase